jgi:hypothetical protein
MATTTLVDLEDEAVLNNTAAIDKVSSDLKSLEIMRLSDLNPDQIRLVAGSADFQTLHLRNVEVGGTIKAFHHWFKEHAPLVDAMRNIMRPARGSHKRTKVTIDGVEQQVSWGEYCKAVYCVSHDHINRLLKGEHTKDGPELDSVDAELAESTEGVEQTVEPKLSRKDLTIVGLQKKNDELLRQVEELAYKLNHPETPEITSVPDAILACAVAKHEAQEAAEPDDDDGFGFVMDYFEPIITPHQFASELDRVIRRCRMQECMKIVMIDESVSLR